MPAAEVADRFGHSTASVHQMAILLRSEKLNQPTLLITNNLTIPAKTLLARYAELMIIENELDAYIGGFHLDALTSFLPLNVDLATTAGICAGVRPQGRYLPRSERR